MTDQRGYILAIDQGTTSSRAILFDQAARPLATGQHDLQTIYPRPGFVEQDPDEILRTTRDAARDAVARAGVSVTDIAAVGITNQRETTLLWDRRTGRPVYNALVWQDRRTVPLCERLKAEGLESTIRERTGLVVDPYFSATKLAWILGNVPDARRRAEHGDLLFGTVDSFLLWHLTGGSVHRTDYSNAARTMLFDIHTLSWDDELLRALGIPRSILPEACPSTYPFGDLDAEVLGASIPITGMAGDQQAAAFGQGLFIEGGVKTTYGTGAFMLAPTGLHPRASQRGLLTTIAWGLADGVTYALEGSVFIAGAAVQWLRDGLGIIAQASEIQNLAEQVPDAGGVVFVPVFAGLGAPYWDASARGVLVGLTGGVNRAHIARATLEAVCYQVRDVLEAMRADIDRPIAEMRVDGGMSANTVLLQLQANIADLTVIRPAVTETTALGAAFFAGLQIGYWDSRDELQTVWTADRVVQPTIGGDEREAGYRQWRRAVERARGWSS